MWLVPQSAKTECIVVFAHEISFLILHVPLIKDGDSIHSLPSFFD